MLKNHGSLATQREMLKNLDVLAYQQWTEEQLRQYPSFGKAEKDLQKEFIRDDQKQQYSLSCDLSQFKKYGPGVYLAFRFLKYMLVVMGCLLIFPLTNMIIFILSQQTFDDTNLETVFQTTTLSSLEVPNGLVNAFNFIVLITLTLSLLYWRYLQTDYVLDCTKEATLSSYFTVIMTKIPNYYRQHDLKEYLEKYYGKVVDIYTPKNYEEDLTHFQQLCQVINLFREEREIYWKDKEHRSCLAMVEHFIKFKEMHEKLSHTIIKHKHYEPYCAFITFQTVQSRNQLLENQEVLIKGCCQKKVANHADEQKLYKGHKLEFRPCKMEPEGIIWENLNLPHRQKLLRCSLIICLLGAFLMAAISIFFVLAAAEASIYHEDYNNLEQSQILSSNDPEIIENFCIQLGFARFSEYSQCKPYFSDYVSYFILYLTFPVVVTALKAVFSILMQKLVVYRRHKYEFYQIQWGVIIITLFYFMKTALIKWFICRSFSFGEVHVEILRIFMPLLNLLATFMPIRPDKIHLFPNFDDEWVAHTSHKIVLIGFFSFNFSILIYFLSKFIGRKCRESQAQTKMTQTQMNEELKGTKFDFEFVYAEMLALFLFCMLYFSAMPIIYLASYFSMVFLYWVVKYKFVRLDSKPPVYSHSINELATKVVLFGLAINSIVSPLYYGGSVEGDPLSLFESMTTYWYYLVNLIIIIMFGFFRVQTLKLYYFIKSAIIGYCYDSVETQTYSTRLSTMVKTEKELGSYSMYQNQRYTQLLKVLYVLNRKQLHHYAQLPRSDIEEIKKQLFTQTTSYKLYDQLCQSLEAEIEKGENNQNTAFFMNLGRCKQCLSILREIKVQIQREIEEEHHYDEFTKSMNSKMKEMSFLNKSSKISEDLNKYDRANSPDEILTEMDDEIITEMGEGELETDTRIGRIV